MSDDRPPFRVVDANFDALSHMLEAQRNLRTGGGGGTSGGVTDEWQASVEKRLGELHGDTRSILRAGIASVVALAMLIGGQYVYFNTKFEAVNQRIGDTNVQVARLEGKVDKLDAKLDLLLDRFKAGGRTR